MRLFFRRGIAGSLAFPAHFEALRADLHGDENLAQQSIRQLRERITHNFRLEPLTLDEIHNYLNFRMREVGYRGPELINRAVARKVEQYSGGLLRRINILADKILLSAFAE